MNMSSLVESVSVLAFGFGPWELAIVAGIVLLIFGNRLPSAAKSLGMSFSAFKKGVKEGENDLDQSPPSRSVGSSSPPEKFESQSTPEKVETQS